MKKLVSGFWAFILIILLIPIVKVEAGQSALYFQTYKYEKADQYVQNTLGDFINCESNINTLDVNEIKLGQGIYVETFEREGSLPTFMYPVFVGDRLEYVYRIYDDGSGNYEGIFGKNYAELLSNNASKDPSQVPAFIENNGNEIMVINNSINIVLGSYEGEEVNYDEIYKKLDQISLTAVDITEENEFVKKPKTRAYNWTLNISIKETQGDLPWCAAYVTATALRYKTGQDIRASQIMKHYGKGTQDACSIHMIIDYSKLKGVTFDGTYNGVISNAKLHGHLRGMNPVYAGYMLAGTTKSHALLIHGINDDKRLVWNPWYSYSEWISSSNTYKTNGKTYTMYRYGTYF